MCGVNILVGADDGVVVHVASDTGDAFMLETFVKTWIFLLNGAKIVSVIKSCGDVFLLVLDR